MAYDRDTRSTGGLLADAVQHLTSLVRGEVELAKAEVAQNLRRAARGVAMIAAAAVVATVGLTVLAGAAVAGLVAQGLAPGWAALTVGGALCLIAALLVHAGRGALDTTTFLPRRASRRVRRDAEQIKEMIHDASQ